jgi:hypothetical protein
MKESEAFERTNPKLDGVCWCPVPEPTKMIGVCSTKLKEKTVKIPKCSRCGGVIIHDKM